MSTSFADIREETSGWINLVAETPGLSGLSLTLQNKGSAAIQIVFGGAEPVAEDAGVVLSPKEAVNGSSTAIWARGYQGFTVAPLEND